jgi:hypothetical protein
LNAIKIELEENINELDSIIKYLLPDVGYSNYLLNVDKDSIDVDSLIHYMNTYSRAEKFSIKTNAFEMFKTSGIMRLLNDKELMLSLWNIYGVLSLQNEELDWYFHLKWTDIQKEFSLVDKRKLIDEAQFRETILKARPLYDFYTLGVTHSLLNNCYDVQNKTKNTIEKLDKVLKIKPKPQNERVLKNVEEIK